MRLPIPEHIRRDIKTTLDAVVGAWNSALSVEGREQAGNRPREGSIVVTLGPIVEEVDDAAPVGHQQFLQTFQVIVSTAGAPEAGEDDPDEKLLIYWADVLKALKTDPHRGGYAVNTFCGAPEFEKNQVIVPVQVRWRCTLGTLYTNT